MKNNPFGHKRNVDQSTGCSPRLPLWLFASAAIFLTGCSNLSTSLPWSDNSLDPGRIATREPLEIPPDLTVLPEVGDATKTPAKEEKQEIRMPWEASAPSPESPGKEALSRNHPEKLPDWMK